MSKPGISKAEALRQTQITFLKDKSLQHPFYWAPFILVGNWL
ncbi:MAG: CHAT domain-containing protein [Rivularia sp. (in: cyanobacteria)]